MKRVLFALACVLSTTHAAAKSQKLPYSYYRLGSAVDVTRPTTAGTVMMGGNLDVSIAVSWLCEMAGNGDLLLVRARDTDEDNAFLRAACPNANSVATLVASGPDAAVHPDTAHIIEAAEAIWVSGGDQSDYIVNWTATPLQFALQAHIDASKPIGGNSAGLAVLGQFVNSAEASQGISSTQALANPYHKWITFAQEFLRIPALIGILGDTHFYERDRMGRDLAFACRIYNNGWSNMPREIAVDEGTALLVEADGAAYPVGAGSVYFLRAPGVPEVCMSRTPLTYRNISVYRIEESGSFDIATWTGAGGTAYQVSANAGVLSSTQPGGSWY